MPRKSNNLDYEKINQDLVDNLPNYTFWKADLVVPFLNKKDKIIEIGAGKGSLSKILKNKGFRIISTDINNRDVDKRLDIKKESIFKNRFDKVICINVLEHIRNDINALKNMNKMLKQNGCLILIVPAFKFLYGNTDRADGHFRRYTKGEIKRKLSETGFKIIEIKYFNFLGFFGWLYHSRLRELRVHNKNDLHGFEKIIPFVRKFEKIVRPIFGLSFLIVAEKLKNSIF